MKIQDTLTNEITLDWDNITKQELKRRFSILSWFIRQELKNIEKAVFYSKTASKKGFRVKILFVKPVPEALTRFNMGDDARRILLDTFRPDDINNINWDVKRGKRSNKWTRIKLK